MECKVNSRGQLGNELANYPKLALVNSVVLCMYTKRSPVGLELRWSPLL